MIAETLDIDGILDKRPYKPPPFTEEELADLKSQAKITISNQQTSITEKLGSLKLADNSGISSLYVFTGKQPCEIALEILARTGFKTQGRQTSYKENIITVDTGERVNLNYISATKSHEKMTKQIELLWCELENSKTAFLLYPEEVPEYLIDPLLSYFKLNPSQLTVLSQYPPVIDTHSLTLFGSDINVDEADVLTEASLVTFGSSNTHKNLPIAHEQFKPVELVTCLRKKLSDQGDDKNDENGKNDKNETTDKTDNTKENGKTAENELTFKGYAIAEEAMGILSLSGVEQFLKLEFPSMRINDILSSLKRKFNEQQMRIYT